MSRLAKPSAKNQHLEGEEYLPSPTPEPEAVAAAKDAVQSHANAVVAAYVEKFDAAIPPRRPCALDDAPVNSKLVVVRSGTERLYILGGPDGEQTVAADDLARTLPEGARIQRAGPTTFIGEQMDPADYRKPLIATTAREVVTRFHAHFHE